MTFQGSGTSGNPITVVFEAGAIMQSTAWGTGAGEGTCPCSGAFTVSGQHDIVIDGGGTPNSGSNLAGLAVQNGIIRNTSDGGIGIYIRQSTNVTIKNLVVGPIRGTGDASFQRAATNILLDGGSSGNSNILLQNNVLPTAGTGVGVEGNPGAIPPHIYRNSISDHCWQISAVEGSTSLVVLIDGNDIGPTWSTASACHTDVLFTNDGTMYIYNNYFHGNIMVGGSPTGYFYCTYASLGSFASSCRVFNNIFESMAGVINGGNGGPDYFYNNTMISSSPLIFYLFQGPGTSVSSENNVGIEAGSPTNRAPSPTQIYSPQYGGTGGDFFTVSDYNDYYGYGANGWWNGNTNLTSWQSQGFDTHSITTNPNMSASFPYTLQPGSPAIGTGANLTSVCNADRYMAPLCYDRLGNPRPTSGAWDMGADVASVSQTGRPTPPTGLTAAVQ
jgi:hypothetical protein